MPLYWAGLCEAVIITPPSKLVLADGEVERVGRNHADVDDVGAGFARAARERFEELLPRGAHVAPDGHDRAISPPRPAAEQRHEAAPDGVGNVIAEFGRINPANVVGLEYRGVHLDAAQPAVLRPCFRDAFVKNAPLARVTGTLLLTAFLVVDAGFRRSGDVSKRAPSIASTFARAVADSASADRARGAAAPADRRRELASRLLLDARPVLRRPISTGRCGIRCTRSVDSPDACTNSSFRAPAQLLGNVRTASIPVARRGRRAAAAQPAQSARRARQAKQALLGLRNAHGRGDPRSSWQRPMPRSSAARSCSSTGRPTCAPSGCWFSACWRFFSTRIVRA